MYKGFDLKIQDKRKLFTSDNEEDYYKIGLSLFENTQKQVRNIINKKVFDEEIINGTELQNNWFPEVNADIFLSHSHADEDLAITFAGWLKKEFGLITFIDSCCWGYSNELALKLNNNYNYNCTTGNYNFDEAMNIAGHVHMMLSTALANMIDKTECIMFLNTPNSVSTRDTKLKTYSPWIYNELEITRIIEKNKKKKLLMENKNYKKMTVEYELSTSHLCKITEKDLINWKMKNGGHWTNMTNRIVDEKYSSFEYLYNISESKGDK